MTSAPFLMYQVMKSLACGTQGDIKKGDKKESLNSLTVHSVRGVNMVRKTHVLIVWAIVCGVMGISSPVCSEGIETFDALYSALPGHGVVDHSKEIDKTVKSLVQLQKLREGLSVTIERPLDVLFYNPRFLSISLQASVKNKSASARAKPLPAVYALLFEKADDNTLTYKNIFLSWIGDAEVGSYASTGPDKMSELFRSKGAQYVFLENSAPSLKAKDLILDGSQIKSGLIDEKYIDADITRNRELQKVLDRHMKTVMEQVSKTRPVAVQSGSDTVRIKQLEDRIQKLESLLVNITRNGDNLYFKNINVLIQNGTGNESRVNGTGNLVVGYDDPGSGSHNIMVGSKNTCTSYGAVVTGTGNVVSKKYGAVIGGNDNKVTGDYAVILGGDSNNASGSFSSILGGSDNKAKGDYSSINGQHGRTKVDRDKNKHFNN